MISIARISKCKECSKEISGENKYKYSSFNYCLDCYNVKIKNKESYDTLIKTLCEYFHIEQPTGLMLKQIKQYKEDFKYNYDGMTYTLWYCKDILSKKFIEKYGVAILKYEYENAKQYYLQQAQIKKSTENITLDNVRYIIQRNIKSNTSNYLIDIDDIIKDGDIHN